MRLSSHAGLVRILAGCAALSAAVVGTARAGMYFLPAVADTWVDEAAPAATGGSDPTLYTLSVPASSRLTFARFDLSSVPANAVVQNAFLTFEVMIPDPSGQPVDVHRATVAWTEAGATWDSLSTSWDSLSVEGKLFAGTTGQTGTDITPLVQRWVNGTVPNNGVALVSTSSGSLAGLAARENAVATPPTLVIQTTTAPTMRVKTGWYTGDGTSSHSISGLGFSPDVVIVKGMGGGAAWIRTSTMNANDSKPLGEPLQGDGKHIKTLTADGFVVGNKPEVNANGQRFDWVAIRSATGEMAVGSYTGDGSSGRVIPGLGLPPAYVMVMAHNPYHAVQRFDTEPVGESHTFAATAPLTGTINSFTGDGFIVDAAPETNTGGTVYHFVAFSSAANVMTGSYPGTGVGPRSITSAGFAPDYVIVQPRTTSGAASFRSSSWSNNVTGPLGPGFYFANGIRSMLPSGFEIGASAQTNALGETYDWVALADTNAVLVMPEADMAISIAVNDSAPNPGQTIQYTLAATNAGPDSSLGLKVYSPVPAGLTYQGQVISTGIYAPSTGIWDLGALGPGDVATLNLDTRVDPVSAGATIRSFAWIAASTTSDTLTSNNYDTTTVRVNLPVLIDDTPGSLYPPNVYPGEPVVALRIGVDNATGVDLQIDTTTTVTFTDGAVGVSAPLANRTVIPGGATGFVLAFAPTSVPTILRADTTYPLAIHLRGSSMAGVSFTDSILTAGTNELRVPAPAITVSSGIIGNETVSPGRNDVTVLSVGMVNNTFADRFLDTLVVTNASSGAGTQGQLDALASRLMLYADVDTSGSRTVADSLLATGLFGGGQVAFSVAGSWKLPAGGFTNLLVCADVDSFKARDGDALDAVIARASDIRFSTATPIANAITPLSPIDSWGVATIDGMMAFQVRVSAASDTLYSGQTNRLLATVDVPPNGYAPDILRAMEVSNSGAPFSPADFTALRLYDDNGDGIFSPLTDVVIGTFAWSGDRFIVTGLALPVIVPHRVFVSADVSGNPTTGDRFVPTVPSGGITMASGNDGPIDTAITPAGGVTVAALQQVEVTTVSVPGGDVRPGDRNVSTLSFTVRNGTLAPLQIDSLVVRNATRGMAGTQAERDAEISAVRVYVDNGNARVDFNDVVAGSDAFFSGGTAGIGLGIPVGAGATISLLVAVDVDSLCSADGDSLVVAIDNAGGLYLSTGAAISGTFPLTTPSPRVIDGRMAHEIAVYAATDSVLITAPTNNLVYSFGLTGNGYQPDTLNTLRIRNTGTATTDHISALYLWIDGGDGVFDFGNGDDMLAGTFVSISAQAYALTALSIPLPGTCGVRARFYVAADIASNPPSGASVQFEIPVGGIAVASGDDGPVDAPAMDPSVVLIPRPNELTVFPYSVGDKSVSPGARNVLNFGVGFYNGFTTPVDLDQITLFQRGAATVGEVTDVTAWADADTNGLFTVQDDRPIATGNSANGTYTLGTLNVSLLPRRLTYVFVTYSLPLSVRDSVDIDFQINTTGDLAFSTKGVTVKGQFPVNAPGVDFTDGFVSEQVSTFPVPGMRVAPADNNVPAMAFRLPSNGFLDDALQYLTVQNSGTATPGGDIAGVDLWVDNGDGVFNAGQDLLLSSLNFTGLGWRNPVALGKPVMTSGLSCWITVNVASTASDGRTIQLLLPANGVDMASGNDGPTDGAITNGAAHTISTDPLLSSISLDRSDYSTGQMIAVSMLARNVGVLPVVGVHPGVVLVNGTGSATLVSGPAPAAVNITPGGDTTFVWMYQAAMPGTVTFCATAFSADSSEASFATCSEPALIHSQPSSVAFAIVDNTPPAVNRAQTGVSGISLPITYPAGDTLGAMVEVTGFNLGTANSSGMPVAPGSIFQLVTVISSKGSNYPTATIDSTSSPLHLNLSPAVQLVPGDSVLLNITLDVSASATLQPFRLSVSSDSAIVARDANSGNPVAITSGASFPWLSGTVRVNSPADSARFVSTDTSHATVNVGQEGVTLFDGTLTNSSPPGAADVLLTSITLSFTDSTGGAENPGDVIRALRITSGTSTLYLTETVPTTSDRMQCVLSAPLLVAAGTGAAVHIEADVRSFPTRSSLRTTVATPTDVDARDNNSGAPVAVWSPVGFPIPSRTLGIQQAATGLMVSSRSLAPATVLPSQAGISFLQLVFTHPDTIGSDVSIDSLSISLVQTSGVPVLPADVFSAVRLTSGDTLCEITALSGVANRVGCRLATPIVLKAGQTDSLEIAADVRAAFMPVDLRVEVNAADIFAVDANDGNRILGIAGGFPLASDPAAFLLPGSSVDCALASILPPNVTGTEPELAAFRLRIHNPSAAGFTPVDLLSLSVAVDSWPGSPAPPTSFARSARLMQADTTVAIGTVGAGTIDVALPAGAVRLPPGASDSLTFLVDLDARSGGAFRFSLRDAAATTFADAATGAPVSPTADSAWPLATDYAHVLGASATASFTNYPNPFAAGREQTRITYLLDKPSHVTIRLYTLWGAPVITLVSNRVESPGLHQDVYWSGRTADGNLVNNGVYYLVLESTANGGGTNRLRRKVAVAR